MKTNLLRQNFINGASRRSCGGKVYVQVSSESHLLLPNEIDLPSHLVDGYVIADNIERDHRQTNKYTHHEGLLNYGDYNDKITLKNDPLYKKITQST